MQRHAIPSKLSISYKAQWNSLSCLWFLTNRLLYEFLFFSLYVISVIKLKQNKTRQREGKEKLKPSCSLRKFTKTSKR